MPYCLVWRVRCWVTWQDRATSLINVARLRASDYDIILTIEPEEVRGQWKNPFLMHIYYPPSDITKLSLIKRVGSTNLRRNTSIPISQIGIPIFFIFPSPSFRSLTLLPPPRPPPASAARSSTAWTPTRRRRRPAATISSILRWVAWSPWRQYVIM